MNLSIVIPAYNEQANIRDAILEAHDAFPGAEIIVVDDASTDATRAILNQLRKEISTLEVIEYMENQGHGTAVITGFRFAHGDYILYIDADRQIDLVRGGFEYMERNGYDVVSGRRIHRQDKWFRILTSFFLKMTILIRHGYYIPDANCPFKMYRRSALIRLMSEVPYPRIVPIACLEVLARRHHLKTIVINTPHKEYQGVRVGFLQAPNMRFLQFVKKAFLEIIHL